MKDQHSKLVTSVLLIILTNSLLCWTCVKMDEENNKVINLQWFLVVIIK